MKNFTQNHSMMTRIITIMVLALGILSPVYGEDIKVYPFDPIRSQYEKNFTNYRGSDIKLKPLLLDTQRDSISSNFNRHYILTQNSEPNQTMLTNETLKFMRKKLEQGIGFYAIGNEPSWALDIDFDMGMRFKSLTEFSEMNTPPGREDKAQDADVTRYFAQTDAGTLSITVSRGLCSDTMSDEQFPYKVRVDVKRSKEIDYTSFNGCGRYVMDSRINDIWVLTKFSGRTLYADDFPKGLPILEFHLRDNRVIGSTGCNQISGRFETRGDKLTIRNLASTRMACPDMAFEHELLTAITDKKVRYSIIDGRLILTDDSGNLMKFKKID